MDDLAETPSFDKYAVGQAVPRNEDPVLVQGAGTYTDDIHLVGEAHAVMVRSDVAHGRLLAVDTAEAKAMPGVLAVLTGEDIAAAGCKPLGSGLPLKNRDGSPLRQAPLPALAQDRVRYVGQPVAMVVAETLAQAKDAADAVTLEIESLPAVTDPQAALGDGAPLLHDDLPGNQCLDWEGGDAAAVEQAFARADHVTRLRLVNNRVVVASMEPRGVVAAFGDDGRLTLHVGCQGAFGMRGSIATALGMDKADVHVLTPRVGGSFGMKAPAYPEYLAAVLAARALKRPVRWIDERSGSFLSDYQGRDSLYDAELALDGDGNFLAVRVAVVGNMGGYVVNAGPMIPSRNILRNLPGPYRTPAALVTSRCALTNTVPTHAYRGAGRPEAVYLMERLVDAAAAETGVDPVELRRRNMIAPDDMPFTTPAGTTYDSGRFAEVLDRALERADVNGLAERRAQSEARGKRRGFGVASYVEVTAPPSEEMGGVRFTEDGRVTIVTGTLDYGQGHATPFAQVLAARLGVPFERIDLVQGDSDRLIAGGGTGGSRSIMASGTAILQAADQVVERGQELAGHVLEAAAADIRFERGRFAVAGTDRGIGIMELAARARTLGNLPEGVPASLDVELVAKSPPETFPNGCHVVELEVDPQTGVVEVARYTAVDDFGTLVNPMMVDGQVHGGIVQGIGQALGERTVYGEDGQLLAGSFMDYALPRADLLPAIDVTFLSVPATTNVLGVKGCGEAGVCGSCPAIINAVLDALRPLGVRELDMPATPERVWQAIAAARAG